MPEVKYTSDYDIFKFRDDNRDVIKQAHVKRLIASIKARDMLELNPIKVNAQMEVIDGQHRLLAAKALGVGVYYMQDYTLQGSDIIRMNISQPWGFADYHNYYCKNGYPEYIKLKEFMEKNSLSIKVAINMTWGTSKEAYLKFKEGNFKFNEEAVSEEIAICWDTIAYIKKMNGTSQYTNTTRFWSALLILIRHANFDAKRWMDNLKKMIERMHPRARKDDYLKLFMEIHNWRNHAKVEFVSYGE